MIGTLVDLLGNFYAINDFTHAETIARTIQASVPNDLVSLQFLGLVYYRTGRVNEAVSVFDRVIRRRKTAALVEPEATRNEIADDGRCAAVCYQEATKRNPLLAKAWFDLGAVLLKLKKPELAMPAFRSYLASQPASNEAILALNQVGLNPEKLVQEEETPSAA